MIIRSIRAENFMRFSNLRLENLPEQGLIGLEGPNESGKSTVGEALLFAFFGRTRAAKSCPLENLIQWGKEFLRVEVEFEARADGKDGSYSIFREIDRFGTNYVKLLELPERREIATGNIRVSEALSRLVGFDYAEFEHAFYHDQYGSRLVDATLCDFVEDMVGVRQMREAGDDLRREIEELERQFGHYQKEIGRNLRQVERHAYSLERLDEIHGGVSKTSADLEGVRLDIESSNEQQEKRRSMADEREAGERRLRALADLKGDAFVEGVQENLREYDALDREHAGQGSLFSELREEFRDMRDGLCQVDELTRGFKDLARAFVEARHTVEAELDGSDRDSLQARFDRSESDRAALKERARRSARGLWFLVVVVVLFAAVPEEVTPFWIASVGAGVAALALLVTLVKIVRSSAFRAHERTAAGFMQDLGRQVENARKQREQLAALESIRESGHLRDFVDAARLVDMASTRRRLEDFEKKYERLLGAGDGGTTGDEADRGKGNGGKGNGGKGNRSRGRRKRGGQRRPDDYRSLLRSLADREKQCRKKILAAVQADDKRIKGLDKSLRSTRSERDRFENELRECEAQRAKKEALEAKNVELEKAAAAIRDQIDDRHAGIELLERAAATVRAKLGPTLGTFVRALLPSLTGGRYKDVKIDEHLEIEVFAADRRDFLPAVELSGGTNEALLLALRLALSQAFVTSRADSGSGEEGASAAGGGAQFVFLDEPFKMMDFARVVEALRALPSMSGDLRQFFVVQPNYTEAQREGLDWLVQTSLESDDLQLGS